MTASSLPSDASSLLVPIHLDGWVVTPQNQEGLAWYYANYQNLKQFASPIPGAFDTSVAANPVPGIHLHWALPDALTHGKESTTEEQVEFPLVPNRWLIARFNTLKDNPWWACKLWVVQSDYLTTAKSTIGKTAAGLSGSSVTSIALQAPGASEPIVAGAQLEVMAADESSSAIVVTAAAVNSGGTQIKIQAHDFSNDLPSGSSVRLLGTSAFLDPFQPTNVDIKPQTTKFNINEARIGTHYTIQAWEARQDSPNNKLFLTAVGPGDVTFAAYVPLVKDVFSFTDTDMPAVGTGTYAYTYLVVGWYSDPQTSDPMRGVTTYMPGIWKSQEEWKQHTPVQRFQTLLTDLNWSVQGKPSSTPPSTSLYHAVISDVQWPYTTLGNAGINKENVRVVVGNTAIDAVAALIQAEAQIEAQENPTEKNAWLAAGNTLAELLQAAQYDLLSSYGQPGGAALLDQQIRQAWFGSVPGGTVWEVVGDVPQDSGASVIQPAPTPAQAQALDKQLAALNQSQRHLDQATGELRSLQANLYIAWWKVGRANSYGWGETPTTLPDWPTLKKQLEGTIYPELIKEVWEKYCAVQQAQSQLPNPTDGTEANQWANAHWTFPKEQGSGTETLEALGLKLKAGTTPRFWHPNDPVVLAAGLHRSQKHGEDGRYNPDGTLTCRLPGQTITGMTIPGQPTIDVTTLESKGINLDPCGTLTKVPTISALVHETFFVDPDNATTIATAVSGDAGTIKTAITDLIEQQTTKARWIGTAPAPFAIAPWEQAWAPLFLEWELHYFPTGTGSGFTRKFSLNDWQFDGEKYTWKGTGFDLNYFAPYKGRTFLTPQAPLQFKAKIEKYLKKNTKIDSAQMKKLLTIVGNWDLLSQSLSSLLDQLITRIAQESFPPPPTQDMTISCTNGKSTPNAPTPSVTALIGDQYHEGPVLEGGGSEVNDFYPIRGGFVQFQKLQVVDAFGQTFTLSFSNSTQGFQPILGQGLTPTNPPANFPVGMVQLPPRAIQPSRLDVRFLANTDPAKDISVSDNPNAICGWILPNHLDGGLAIYDASGILLGELLSLPAPNNWRPRPGPPGTNPPPQTPTDIKNTALKDVITSMAGQSSGVFNDLLQIIDETLWMVDPLGGRKDQMLSAFIGRPLAVVQAQVQLRLYGNPDFSYLWNAMLTHQAPYKQTKDVGPITDVAFPVRLGSLELRHDGLIGYYLPSQRYSTFYAVHNPEKVSSGDTYIKQILTSSGDYQGNIHLKYQGPSVTVTMLVDPRGSVHAYTGILPVTSAALEPHLVEDFIKHMKVTFRTGPIIADPGTLRTPKPAEDHGVWTWIQRVAQPTDWEEDPIVDATDRARLPNAQLQLREGWLQLSEETPPGQSTES